METRSNSRAESSGHHARGTAPKRTPAALALVALVRLVTACGPVPPGIPSPDADDGWHSSPTAGADRPSPSRSSRPSAIPPEQRRPWPAQAALPTWAVVGERGRSEHLGGRFERTLRRNELAAGYERPGGPPAMPPGAIIAELHHEPGEEEIRTVFVMRKLPTGSAPKHGDWSFEVLDGELRMEAQLPLDLCADCHRTARHDGLFGLPEPGTRLPND